MKAVIFTDLDGTLIDHNSYSATPASEAIRGTKEAGIPICICSSKTRREIVYHRNIIDISDPFISENGGAIFIPKGYFERNISDARMQESFEIVELGTPYNVIVTALCRVRAQLQIRLRGFHEITPEELAGKSGLPIHLAQMALDREYDEPFWIEGNGGALESVINAFRNEGLQVTRGSRFHHVMGNNDKGKAVGLLSERFKHHYPNVVFAGIGDSPNDIPMLRRVDIPILVKTHFGNYDEETRYAVSGLRLVDGIGPYGWNTAVNILLSEWR